MSTVVAVDQLIPVLVGHVAALGRLAGEGWEQGRRKGGEEREGEVLLEPDSVREGSNQRAAATRMSTSSHTRLQRSQSLPAERRARGRGSQWSQRLERKRTTELTVAANRCVRLPLARPSTTAQSTRTSECKSFAVSARWETLSESGASEVGVGRGRSLNTLSTVCRFYTFSG